MIGISDLEYLCAEVRQIARKAGAFLRDERQKFDRERVEEKSAHNCFPKQGLLPKRVREA